MRVVLVDDLEKARAGLRHMLEHEISDVEVVSEADNVPTAVKVIQKTKPDVVFLDIEMPGYSGLELLDFFDAELITWKIVFVTAYSEYALQAFKLSAVDYLLKPLAINDLQRAIQKLKHTPDVSDADTMQLLRQNLQAGSYMQRKLSLRTLDAVHFVKLENILYLRADGPYCHFHLAGAERLTVTKPLSEYSYLQGNGGFFRVHRSYMVNLHHISKVLKAELGTVLLDQGESLPISPDRRVPLIEAVESLFQ